MNQEAIGERDGDALRETGDPLIRAGALPTKESRGDAVGMVE